MTTTPEPPVPPPGEEPEDPTQTPEAAPWSDGRPTDDVPMEPGES